MKTYTYKKIDLRDPKRVFYKTDLEYQSFKDTAPLKIQAHWKFERLTDPIKDNELKEGEFNI